MMKTPKVMAAVLIANPSISVIGMMISRRMQNEKTANAAIPSNFPRSPIEDGSWPQSGHLSACVGISLLHFSHWPVDIDSS